MSKTTTNIKTSGAALLREQEYTRRRPGAQRAPLSNHTTNINILLTLTPKNNPNKIDNKDTHDYSCIITNPSHPASRGQRLPSPLPARRSQSQLPGAVNPGKFKIKKIPAVGCAVISGNQNVVPTPSKNPLKSAAKPSATGRSHTTGPVALYTPVIARSSAPKQSRHLQALRSHQAKHGPQTLRSHQAKHGPQAPAPDPKFKTQSTIIKRGNQ